MKKKFHLLKFFVLLVFFVVPMYTAGQAQSSSTDSNWTGKYTYTYSEGITQGGWVPVIEYVVDITREGDSLIAHFTADGYQSNENFACTAKISGNRLNLYFLKDLRDVERYDGVNNMRRGQFVGSLNKSMTRGRIRYDYRDGALILRGVSKTPVYFKKLR